MDRAMSTLKMIKTDERGEKYLFGEYITKNDAMFLLMNDTQSNGQFMAVFSHRLRELREQAGMSQEELSQAVWDTLHMNKKGSQPHISNMESPKGGKLPSVPVLRALALILKTNTDYLLGLTNNYRPFGDLED